MFLSFVWVSFSFLPSSWFICLSVTKRGRRFYDSCAHSEGEKCIGGEDILLWENLVLLYACFLGVLWCFVFYALLLSSHHVYVLNMHTSSCLFGWSFALLCGHCSHFYMTILVYDQVAHMFHIMFTWSQFTWYILLVLYLLALPWGSNVFCASVLGYKYICSKFITTPEIHDRGRKRERALC